MKISELENILKENRENYGDIEISFGYVDNEENSYCNCEADIEMDKYNLELNITVL